MEYLSALVEAKEGPLVRLVRKIGRVATALLVVVV